MKEEEYKTLALDSPAMITKKERSVSDLDVKNTKQLRDEIKMRKQALREVARVQATSKIGLSKLVNSEFFAVNDRMGF